MFYLETDKNYSKKNKNKKQEMKSLEMQECQFENSVLPARIPRISGLKSQVLKPTKLNQVKNNGEM